MNTVYIHSNEYCDVHVYDYNPLNNSTLLIYITSVQHGYTFKSVSISVNGETPTVLSNNGHNYEITDVPGIRYKIPFPVTVDNALIEISTDVYVNPIITEIRYNNNYSIDSYEFTSMKPELLSKCGFTNITMAGGWKFLKYEIYEVGNDDTPQDIRSSFNGHEFTIPKSYENRQFYIVIYNDPDSIPITIVCYAFSETSRTYEKIDTDIIYKTPEDIGTYFNYVPKPIKGYASNSNLITGIAVFESGNAIPVYYSPVFYLITGLFCNISTQSGNSSVKYTETVTITFNSSKYTGDPTDVFDHWETANGYPIPNNTSTIISFQMPNMDIIIYPVMKPTRTNSNLYKNLKLDNPITEDSIYESFLKNKRYADDILQINHNLNIGDIVYLDNSDNKYKKAIADGTFKSLAVGIVRNINSADSFGIQYGGYINLKFPWPNTESSIMYLSDTEAGKFKYYSDIENRVYIPIAVYTHNGIIICMHEGTVGAEYPYYPDSFTEEHGAGPAVEKYSGYEIDDTIQSIISAYIQE